MPMPDTTLIARLVGIDAGSALARALETRAEVMRLSEASHDAVVVPREPGGLSHGLRAALAARMARQNADAALAAHYDDCLKRSGECDATLVAAAELARVTALVAHCDMLTLAPKQATRGHVEALKRAGVTEADIVRLSELAAFVNYQARVIAGLRSLKR